MYTDVCSITNVTTTKQFGETTGNEVTGVPCREELNDKSPSGKSGQSGDKKTYKRLYILQPSTLINLGDRIKTTKRRGITVTSEYSNVSKVFPIGGDIPHHIEAYIE